MDVHVKKTIDDDNTPNTHLHLQCTIHSLSDEMLDILHTMSPP